MNCKIIQDLLPLYCDRVCSEESAQLVEEHLADCGDCTALLAELRKGPAPASPEEAEEDAREQSGFQAVRRRILSEKAQVCGGGCPGHSTAAAGPGRGGPGPVRWSIGRGC